MPRSTAELPHALGNSELAARLRARTLAVFFDYDGTLTPIVARPELAVLGTDTRFALEALAARCTVGVISGRDLADVHEMVAAAGLWYAGSHGFDVLAPDGRRFESPLGAQAVPALGAAYAELTDRLATIPGAWVERKRFAVAVHFRQVEDAHIGEVEAVIDAVRAGAEGLRKTGGKRIWELRPDVEWDKGRALWWLLELAGLPDDVEPVYVGDDVTDEDAFVALGARGIGLVVEDGDRPTSADYTLRTTDEVRQLLIELATIAS